MAATLKADATRAWKDGDVPRATMLFSDALACAQDSDVELRAKLHGNLFQCKKKTGLWLNASVHAQSACDFLPNWAKAHAYLSEARCKLRQWEAAKAAATVGLACDPDADVKRFLRTQLAEAKREASAAYVCCDPDNEREIEDLLVRYQRANGDIDKESVMIRKQPMAGHGDGNFGWTNLNFLHVAAWHGDGRLVDALAAAGAAIDFPTLPRDTHDFKFAGGTCEASGGRPVRILPAPADLTPLVLSCTMLAFRTLSEMMGASPEEFGELPSPDGAIRLVALGADLKKTLCLPSDICTPSDPINCVPFVWQQLGLANKTALQLALISCNASLIKECVARGVAITSQDVEACPPPIHGRVRALVGQCSPAAPMGLPADLYDCRCGSRLLWSRCHGTDKQVHLDERDSGRFLLRYSPCAPCPCKTKTNPPYFKCCWDGPDAWFGDDATGAISKVTACTNQMINYFEQFKQMRLGEGVTPDAPLFPARDAHGRALGRHMTREEWKQHQADGIRSGLAFEIMAETFGPQCRVASQWDREVVAGVVALIDNEFTWVDTHWAIPVAELHARVEEWNEALCRYLDSCELSEDHRQEVQRRHTASPFAPCANPGCSVIESQVKQFQMCFGCKRVAYCSSACQADHWMSGHQQCCGSIDMTGHSIGATRTRAYAWKLLAPAQGPQSTDAAVQRLLAVMVLMCELPAEDRSVAFFDQAAAVLMTLTRSESVAAAIAELAQVVSLWEAEAPESIRRALEQLRRQQEQREEVRLCRSCGRRQGREAFSQNQWRSGQRRCLECQRAGVLTSVDELAHEAAEEEDRAAMAALHAEGMAKERARIQEELSRRNACERSDNECAVCFEETGVDARCAMPCNSRHWLCKGCLDISIEHTRRIGASFLPCHMCRMPLALLALQSVWLASGS